MKLAIFLILFIGGVLGLEKEIVKTPAWVDKNSLSKAEDGNLRNLASCRTCSKTYLYETDCGPMHQNPAMHRNYKMSTGECAYACCTDMKDDPKCCRVGCDHQCDGSWVINGNCRSGYKRNMMNWGSFEIGPDGPTGYRQTALAEYIHTNPRCYHGCCSAETNVIEDTNCCVKA